MVLYNCLELIEYCWKGVKTASVVRPFLECKHLTHWGLVTHICVTELARRWLRCWVVACSVLSHFLGQRFLKLWIGPLGTNYSKTLIVKTLTVTSGVSVNIGSGYGLSPGRRQAITWTNVDLFPIRPNGTYFNEILLEIQKFSFMKMRLKCRLQNGRHLFNLNVLLCVFPWLAVIYAYYFILNQEGEPSIAHNFYKRLSI